MHIIVVPSWYSSSSNKVHGSFFKEQFIALQNSGVKITVAYNEIWPITKLGRVNQKRGLSFEIEDGLKTYRYKDYNYLPKNSMMFHLFNKRMEKLYLEIVKKEGGVDAIHAHSAFWGGISAAYVAKKYNIPFVLTEHSSLTYSKYVQKGYIKWIKKAYDSADALIAVGNGLKNEMEAYTNNEIQVIHNMVDFNLFKPKVIKKEQNTIELFSLAFLVEEKGMELLIQAFNNVFKDKNILLKIGGDGYLKPALEELVNKLDLKRQVIFLGALSREEVANQMNKCDGFVLASEHETFGAVYTEALAVGKPVLGTYNGGAEDIIKEYNGILVKNKDIDKLSEGLVSFVSKLSDFNKEEIIEKCYSEYSEETIINKIKAVYNSLKGVNYEI